LKVISHGEKSQKYQFNADQQLTGLLHTLVDIAERCRDKNRINGSIVEVVSRQSRHPQIKAAMRLIFMRRIAPDIKTIPRSHVSVWECLGTDLFCFLKWVCPFFICDAS